MAASWFEAIRSLTRGAAVCGLATLAVGAALGGAVAGVKITVTYDEAKTEVSPRQRTFSTSETKTYTLHGINELNFSGTGGFKSNSGIRLGNELVGPTSDGLNYKVVYKIQNGALLVITNLSSYTTTRVITTNQKTTCSATLEYKKKAGHQYFEVMSAGNPVSLSDMHAENMTCSITETTD